MIQKTLSPHREREGSEERRRDEVAGLEASGTASELDDEVFGDDEHRKEQSDTEEVVYVPSPPELESDTVGDDDDEGLETSSPKIVSSPYAPSRQERAEHRITHCPFRSWCPDCVAGKNQRDTSSEAEFCEQG